MHKAIFLDRDGVINKDVDNLHKIEDIIILDKVPEALKHLKSKGYLLIVVSNQPVISRGWITEDGVKEINEEMNRRILKSGGSKIDRFYFWPHHPDAQIEKYKKNCDCRKPGIGMIVQAVEDFGIDIDSSFMIGDRISDIVMGQKAGCKTILIESEHSHTKLKGRDYNVDTNPDFIAKSLFESVSKIK